MIFFFKHCNCWWNFSKQSNRTFSYHLMKQSGAGHEVAKWGEVNKEESTLSPELNPPSMRKFTTCLGYKM